MTTFAQTSGRVSPVNGQVISRYSGCRRRMSEPFTPRTGMKGRPNSAARNWARTVAQQLSRTSTVPVSAARR